MDAGNGVRAGWVVAVLGFAFGSAGCFQLYQPPVANTGAGTDGEQKQEKAEVSADQLKRDAAGLFPGEPDESHYVRGTSASTTKRLEVSAGECYDVAAATDPSLSTTILLMPDDVRHYPAERVGKSSGSDRATLSFCVDADGWASLGFSSQRPVDPSKGPLARSFEKRRYLLAVWKRGAEQDEARRARHESERSAYRLQQKRECNELDSRADVFDCMTRLGEDIADRDARAQLADAEKPAELAAEGG